MKTSNSCQKMEGCNVKKKKSVMIEGIPVEKMVNDRNVLQLSKCLNKTKPKPLF